MLSSTHPTSRLQGLLRVLCLCTFLPLLAPAQSVPATSVPLRLPSAIVFDARGNLYFAETASHLIRKVDTTGQLWTIAGSGVEGFSGDGGPATSAQLDSPRGLALDTANHLYIADTLNHRIRRLDLTTGLITTVVGAGVPGFGGDNGPALTASLNHPTALAVAPDGALYIADSGNHRIRRLDPISFTLTTVAGTGVQGRSGDMRPATSAALNAPSTLAIDSASNLYLANPHDSNVRRVDHVTGLISTIPTPAPPEALAIDASGTLYIADRDRHQVLRFDTTTGKPFSLAGTGSQGFAGDNAAAISARLDSPAALALSPQGLVTLSDTGNNRIRQIASDNTIHTIAGLGDTVPGTLMLNAPSVVAYGTGTLTASLSSATPATGPVTFLEASAGSVSTLGIVNLTSGAAILSTASLSAGTHSLFATYPGDLTHPPAQSTSLALTISPQPVTATPNPVTVTYGQPIPAITGTLQGVLPQDATSLSATFTTAAAPLAPAGVYPIVTTLSGSAAGNYALTPTPANLTIAPAPTTLSLFTTVTGSAITGQQLPLTLQLQTANTGSPTGTVTIADGGAILYTGAVPATGILSFSISSLSPGAHLLTATYNGDPNFLTSTSAPLLISVAAPPPSDFSLQATGVTSQTVSAGSAASFTFSTQSINAPLSSPILLAASGLPLGATASFNPTYLPPGTSTNAFILTITTPTTANLRTTPHLWLAITLIPLALVVTPRRLRAATPLLLLLLCVGCGARVYTGNADSTAPRTYNVTVTGTATNAAGVALVHTATVTLNVQ